MDCKASLLPRTCWKCFEVWSSCRTPRCSSEAKLINESINGDDDDYDSHATKRTARTVVTKRWHKPKFHLAWHDMKRCLTNAFQGHNKSCRVELWKTVSLSNSLVPTHPACFCFFISQTCTPRAQNIKLVQAITIASLSAMFDTLRLVTTEQVVLSCRAKWNLVLTFLQWIHSARRSCWNREMGVNSFAIWTSQMSVAGLRCHRTTLQRLTTTPVWPARLTLQTTHQPTRRKRITNVQMTIGRVVYALTSSIKKCIMRLLTFTEYAKMRTIETKQND